MRVQDTDIARKRNKTLNQFERVTWQRTKFTSLGVVLSINEKIITVKLIPSAEYTDYDMKDGYSPKERDNEIVDCYKVVGLDLVPNDIVLVVFTDMDSRDTIRDLQRGRKLTDNFTTSNKEFHSSNYGVIVNKVDI